MSTAPVYPPRAVFSVDLEDYFHVEAFSRVVGRERWDSYSSRVEHNTYRLLDLLDDCNVKGTFFILGWVAERYPWLVQRIVQRGHEPACHSYWHRLVYTLTPEEFRRDTQLAKDRIEQAAGEAIRGYRAPSFSITRRSMWAPQILVELGFSYDSSIFPVRHDFYGIPEAPRRPFRLLTDSGALTEYPMTTFRIGSTGPNLPVGGGGYLRLLPYWYTQMGIQRAQLDGVPVVAYLHPWEIDPEQPRIEAGLKSRIRHYTNLTRTEERVRRLQSVCTFSSFRAFTSQMSISDRWDLSTTRKPLAERAAGVAAMGSE